MIITDENNSILDRTFIPNGKDGQDGASITITDTKSDDKGVTVTFSDGKTIFIPRGEKGNKGDRGEDGLSIYESFIDKDGNLIIRYTNGRVINAGRVRDPKNSENPSDIQNITVSPSGDVILVKVDFSIVVIGNIHDENDKPGKPDNSQPTPPKEETPDKPGMPDSHKPHEPETHNPDKPGKDTPQTPGTSISGKPENKMSHDNVAKAAMNPQNSPAAMRASDKVTELPQTGAEVSMLPLGLGLFLSSFGFGMVMKKRK